MVCVGSVTGRLLSDSGPEVAGSTGTIEGRRMTSVPRTYHPGHDSTVPLQGCRRFPQGLPAESGNRKTDRKRSRGGREVRFRSLDSTRGPVTGLRVLTPTGHTPPGPCAHLPFPGASWEHPFPDAKQRTGTPSTSRRSLGREVRCQTTGNRGWGRLQWDHCVDVVA